MTEAEMTGIEDTQAVDEAGTEAQEPQKRSRRRRKPQAEPQATSATVTVKGRISTGYLRAGQVVTVEKTEQVADLLARGYLTEVQE